MIKNIYKFITILIITTLLILIENNVYGFYVELDNAIKLHTWDLSYNVNDPEEVGTDDISKDLSTYYGYEGDFMNQMKFTTTVTVESQTSDKYIIRVGSDTSTLTVSFNDLQNKWGFSGTDNKETLNSALEGDEDIKLTWDVILIVSEDSDYWVDGTVIWYEFKIYINEIYANYDEEDVEDYNEGLAREIAGESVNWTTGNIDSNNFFTNLKNNPAGTLISLFWDLIRVLGDAIQRIINLIQNSTLHISSTLMYSYSELEEDGTKTEVDNDGGGNTDAFTDVGAYGEGLKEGQISVEVSESSYTEDTKIPVVTMDLYTIAANNINFFDINFLTGDEDHDSGSPWMIIRNIIVILIYVSLYVSAVLLITLLIWHGIQVVVGSFNVDNPEKRMYHRKGLESISISIAMLVGSVVIMGLCIFLTDELCSYIMVDTINNDSTDSRAQYELPIRVNVESAGYSFSTNLTGYVRYMTEIEDVTQYANKMLYTILYIILVVGNVALTGFMIFRLLVLWGLSVMGPFLAVLYALYDDGKSANHFQVWAKRYVILSLSQIVLALCYRIIIEIAF